MWCGAAAGVVVAYDLPRLAYKVTTSVAIFVPGMPPCGSTGAKVSTLVLIWQIKVPSSLTFPLTLPVPKSWTKVSSFWT